jgi:hypothetical protein
MHIHWQLPIIVASSDEMDASSYQPSSHGSIHSLFRGRTIICKHDITLTPNSCSTGLVQAQTSDTHRPVPGLHLVLHLFD